MDAIYIHIPFCKHKCSYCAFCSYVCAEEKINEYVDYLVKEIKNFKNKDDCEINTIYIGGGTPNILSNSQLKIIIDAVKSRFKIAKDYEFTIECNPCLITKNQIEHYKTLGVNRVSIGIQSLDDKQLKFIERIHNSEKALEAIKVVKDCGIDNISCDLLIGLKEKYKSFKKHLKMLIKLKVKHFSLYMLQIENGTKLEKIYNQDKNVLLDDEKCVKYYEKTTKFLKKFGYNQYEISNFALKGYESKHNQKYWINKEYAGFGMSAHSYLGDARIANADNFKDYYADNKKFVEHLTNAQKIEERIMLGLRNSCGVNKLELKNLGYDINTNENFLFYIKKDILYEKYNFIYLNPKFYGVSNNIILNLLPN